MIMDFGTMVGLLPSLITGAAITLALTAWIVVFGFVIALPVALGRDSRHTSARWFYRSFVFVFRGAPLLVLLYLIYYGSPQLTIVRDTRLWTFFRDPWPCAILAMSLNSAGYLAEIISGALRDVPRGEVEATVAAGFSRWSTFRDVVAPNAIRLGLRPYGNELIFVVKGTSVASLVTIIELMGAANAAYFETYDPITPLLLAAIFYLGIVWSIRHAIMAIERSLIPELRVAGMGRQLARARSAR